MLGSLKDLLVTSLSVCCFHPQGALNLNDRTIPQPRMLQLSVEKLSREGAFLMDAGMVHFTEYKILFVVCATLLEFPWNKCLFTQITNKNVNVNCTVCARMCQFFKILNIIACNIWLDYVGLCSQRWSICGLVGTATPRFSRKSWDFPIMLPCLITW